jgi:MerR family mercuric resistance operon transcriptional regulator
MQDFLIGEMSRRTGVNIETIRYYERVGVMPRPKRNAGGHRLYDKSQLNRLAFIKHSRDLGFSLKQVRTLLTLVGSGEMTCSDVHALTVEHLTDVKSKIADLRKLEHALKDLAAQCSLGNVSDCPIVETLYGLP